MLFLSKQAIVIPSALTSNIRKKDFLLFLEAKCKKNVLTEVMAVKPTTSSNVSKQYYLQALMVQSLQHALPEVDLYAISIANDGLCLLKGATTLLCYLLTLTFKGRCWWGG